MKVSVVIPIYNVENYLRKCIDSVIAQSYPNIEIILVNDGSTDGSKEICMEYEATYRFIKLINQANSGVSVARNTGIANATGEYLLFLDSDDYWTDDAFLVGLTEYIKKRPNVDYVFFKYKYYFQKKNLYKEPSFTIEDKELVGKSGCECLGYILKKMEDYQWFSVTGIIRRELLIKHQLFFVEGRKYEDMLWTPQVFLHAKEVGFYDHVVYIYRLEREGQITNEVSLKILEDNLFAATNMYNQLKSTPIKEELKKDLFMNVNKRYFYIIKYAGFLNGQEKCQIIDQLKEHQYLLRFSKGSNKLIMLLCHMLGYSAAITLLYWVNIFLRYKNNEVNMNSIKNKRMVNR